MRFRVQYGLAQGEFVVPEDQLVGHFSGPAERDAGSPDSIVARALSHPLEAPPLERACTPDDHVTLVIDPTLPDLAELISPILRVLVETVGIAGEHIALLHAVPTSRANIDLMIDSLPDEFGDVEVVEHQPDDAGNIAYLACTESGRRVYLNRRIVDADLFLMVGQSGYDLAHGRHGPSTDLFPAMSNSETLRDDRQSALADRRDGIGRHQQQEGREVARLAGLFYSLTVSLGSTGEIQEAWFGRFDMVEDHSHGVCDLEWSLPMPESAPDLVVAVLSRSTERSSIASIARGLESAGQLLGANSGMIALICDADESLSPDVLRSMQRSSELDDLEPDQETGAPDDFEWSMCLRLADRHKVFVVSSMDNDMVESLGMVPAQSLHEIENLARRTDRVFVLENADRVSVRSAERHRS